MLLSELWEGAVVQTPAADVPFEAAFDVIVCGLGNSGALAALFAAENGLSVLGIENLGAAGGTITLGGIPFHYFGCPGGRADAVEEARDDFGRRYDCEMAESGRFVLEEKLLAQGVEVLYNTRLCGIYLQDKTVKGVRVLTPEGIRTFGCRVLMDCTGDGFAAVMAGCESSFGRERDGLGQPYSRVCWVRRGEEVFTANMDFGRVDPLDDLALTQALVFSGAYSPVDLSKFGRLMRKMPLIGIREGRHILSEEQMCVADVFAGKRTGEPAFYTYSDLDKHGWDKPLEGDLFADWAVGANLNAYNMSFPVPWKSIIPKGFDGLLVPCRALGADRDVAGSVRMIPDMNKLAETAADVALLAIRHDCRLLQIPYAELEKRLRASGCLDEAHDKGLWVDGKVNWRGQPLTPEKVDFYTDPQQLEARLATLQPGLAIWSARRMGAAARPVLCGLLTSPEENTRKHAALALASMGDAAALPQLREMAAQRDAVMLQDCRKYNQHRGPMAIYHLGRLADAQSVDLLLDVLCSETEAERPIYAPSPIYPWQDFRVLLFMFICNATAALVRIGDACPGQRAKIAAGFEAAFADGRYYARLTDRPQLSSEGGMAANLAAVAFAAARRWAQEKK